MEINEKDFAEKVTNGSGYSFVKFSASWCGPCKQLKITIEEMLKEGLEDDIKSVNFHSLDVDESSDTAASFSIMSVPTMILFKDGKEIDRKTGSLSKSSIVDWIRSKIS